jgi:hypothetical protein
MGKIGHGYGSEWHLLRYLGYHREYLTKQIYERTGGQSLAWLDFRFLPLNKSKKHDGEHIGVSFLGDTHVREAWRSFWPQSGNSQNWDAVGKVDFNGQQEWLLVEAKAHLGELKSNCGASNLNSIDRINAALSQTIGSFCDSPTPLENWLSPYYQYANRLAMLHFLMKVCDPPIPARLLFIYFLGDQHDGAICPQTTAEWEPAIKAVENRLGIDPHSQLYQRVHRMYLTVNPVAHPHM